MTQTPPMRTQQAVVRVSDGLQFTVLTDADDDDDPVAASLMAGNFALADLLDLIRQVVPPGGRIIDLGAHVGTLTLAAAAAGYEVLAVEASPRNAALLRASIELNGFTNVHLVNAAVSDKAGFLRFHSHGPYGHVATGEDASAVAVEALTVDELMARVGWDNADFIKLDVEGSEVAAIKGMKGVMGSDHPPPLYCESNGHMLDVFGQSPLTLKSALVNLGCDIYLVQPHRLVRVQADEPQGQTVIDYLAVKSLPAGLASRRIDAALTDAERMAWLQQSATSPVEPERLYAARVLGNDSNAFGAGTQVEMIRETLSRDSSERVRLLAQRVPPASGPGSSPPERGWWGRLPARIQARLRRLLS